MSEHVASSLGRDFITQAFAANAQRNCRTFILHGTPVVIKHHPDVFPCMPASLVLAETLPSCRGLRVADVGTGTGILALAAAIVGAMSVLATDCNERAVELANKNFKANQYSESCYARRANILPKNAGRFDVIVSNPPWMRVPSELRPSIPSTILRAVDGGTDGLTPLRRLLQSARCTLNTGGQVITIVPLWGDGPDGLTEFSSAGWRSTILREFVLPDWLPMIFGNNSQFASDILLRIVSLKATPYAI